MSRLRRAPLALLLAASLAPAAQAWDWSGATAPQQTAPQQAAPQQTAPSALAALEMMLARLPAMMVQPGAGRAEIAFADFAATRSLDVPGVPRDPPALRTVQRAMPPSRLAAELSQAGWGWTRTIGFSPDDVAQMLLLDALPLTASLMALNPGATAMIPEALAASGYALDTQLGPEVWARGEDERIDMRAREPDDPFRGTLGRAARVALDGDLLRHASTWPLLSALLQAPSDPATGAPTLAAMLAAAEPPAGAGSLLRAYLLPDAAGIEGSEWHRLRGLLLADYSTGPESTAVLVIALTTEAAEGLAETLRQRWDTAAGRTGRTFADLAGAPVTIEVRTFEGGLLAMRWALTLPTDTSRGYPRNAAFELLHSALMQRDTAFLP